MPDTVREVRARMGRGALEGLIVSAEDVLGKAVDDAPIDEGTLRGSATLVLIVNGTRFEGDGSKAQALAAVTAAAMAGLPIRLEVEVAFNTVYAARQHEELAWQHPRGGRAKYLEANLTANAGRYERIVRLAAQRGA